MALLGAAVSCFCCFGLFQVANLLIYLCIKMLIQYKLKFSLYQINFTCVTNQLPLVSKRLCIEMTLYRNDFVSKWLCIKMTRHPSLNHTLSPPGFKKWSPARRISWLLNKFPLSTLWDVSRRVRRICKLMLGCEGSKYIFFLDCNLNSRIIKSTYIVTSICETTSRCIKLLS